MSGGLLVVGLVLVVVVFKVRKARRAAVLAGRDSARPVYSIEPPRRRLSGIGRERL